MTGVTLPQKRYRQRVSVCAACHLLYDTTRAHAVTCSGKCCTWLHRHPEQLAELTALCVPLRITPAMVLDCRAVMILCPDLVDALRNGTMEIRDTREQVYREFMRRVFAEAKARLAKERAA